MPAGRPPKDSKDKAARGTLRKSRVRKPVVKADTGTVYIPGSLDSGERLAWQTLAPVLRSRDMLTADYAPAFEQLCCSWARVRLLTAAVKVAGMVYRPPALDSRGVVVLDADKQPVLGTTRATPEGQALHAEVKIMKMWLSAFGLTPADIGRVDLPPPADDKAPGFDLLD